VRASGPLSLSFLFELSRHAPLTAQAVAQLGYHPSAVFARFHATTERRHRHVWTHLNYMSHHPAAADTDEQQHQPQCRICLDGPDPDLGRLIRPCLCSGTVSVGQAFPSPLRIHTEALPSLNSTYISPASSDGGIPPPMPRPSSFVPSVATVIALLAPRSLASLPTQVRQQTSPPPPLSAFRSRHPPPSSPPAPPI